MVTTYHIQHPLSHGGAAVAWWAIHYLVRCVISVTIILLTAISTPWNEEQLPQALLPIIAIFILATTQKFFTKFTSNQISFHTPGYLARFKINETIKGSKPAINEITTSIITLTTLTTFYLANPHNDTYSTLAVVFGWTYTVTNLVELGRTTYTLSILGQLKDKENWWFFLSPLTGLLVAVPLYKSFPAFAGIPANTNLAATLLTLAAAGYMTFWGAKKLLVP